MSSLQQAFDDVQILVKTFTNNYNHYMSPGYSEAEARQDFIDNFFIALGWDVRHKDQTNPYEQEVKIEKSQSQQNESARKRADYAFYKTPNYKEEVFFAEAKKPSVLIQHNPQHYFQTIKYGWNSGCAICILTDFEELVIVDCRQKPDIKYALNGHHKIYRYTDYADIEIFAEIYWLFSHEAVMNNSLQKYAAALPKPKGKVVQKALFKGGYQAIDDSFLEYIDAIRENIAKAFKKNNEELNSEQLTEATQRTIDRLVFIRFLEDKFIEAAEHVSEWKSWKDFISDCRKLDVKYNGVVFKKHFIDDPNFLGADENLFLDICSDISNLNSPYDFNYIPIHILGSIYERFLGKVVRATDKRVFIEEKPEVRKAGGVYYTPKYIVDYIVQNTVGKIIEGLTPKQITEKHFADIACGSGSFLIGVYDCLLDYHKKWYREKFDSRIKKLQKEFASYQLGKRGTITEDGGNIELRDGQWILTLKLKQQILLNNIYGVDIDAQAAEVTQLSLFLKMLEDETVATTTAGSLFSKVLPDLSKNIVCGNSLIGFDIMNGQLFEDDELKKLNPMDYETVFPKIMGNGFDAIVGNPPYIPIETFSEIEKKYYQTKFSEFKRKYDSSVVFISKALSILNKNGLLGYISSQTWETGENYSEFRKNIVLNYGCVEIINLPFNIFKDAYVDTGIFIFSKNYRSHYNFYSYAKKEKIEAIPLLPFEIIKTSLIKEPDYKLIFNNTVNQILQKLSTDEFINLGAITISTQGLAGSRFDRTPNASAKWNLPFYNAIVKRYFIELDNGYTTSLKEMPSLYKFYEKGEKILIRRIINRQDRMDATYLNDEGVFKKDLNPFILTDSNYNIKYLLALINSKLFSWIYLNSSSIATKDDFRQTTLAELRKLPIRKISSNIKKTHDHLVAFVNQMLDSKKQLSTATTDGDINFLQNKCTSIDRQIDKLVYELYGLSEEEIKIIEGN